MGLGDNYCKERLGLLGDLNDAYHRDCIEQFSTTFEFEEEEEKRWMIVLYSEKSFRLRLRADEQHSYKAGLQRRAKYKARDQTAKEEESGISLATFTTTAFLEFLAL